MDGNKSEKKSSKNNSLDCTQDRIKKQENEIQMELSTTNSDTSKIPDTTLSHELQNITVTDLESKKAVSESFDGQEPEFSPKSEEDPEPEPPEPFENPFIKLDFSLM